MEQAEVAGSLLKQFEDFMIVHGKTYSSTAEKLIRFANFKANLKVIDLLNAASDGTVWYGVNSLTDLSFEEYRALLTFKPNWNETEDAIPTDEHELTRRDNSTEGAVDLSTPPYAPIEDQGECGSCYAFTVVGSIAIAYSKKAKTPTNLSEQQLVDCTKEASGGCETLCTKNAGCKGGDFPQSFKYAKTTGLVLESTYPYIGKDGTCKKNLQPVAFVDKYYKVSGSVALKVLHTYPVATMVNADAKEFQNYVGGVMKPKGPCPTIYNHGVTAVGYRKVKNEVIIKVRNSWGTGWGQAGHFEMPLGVCGLLTHNYAFTLK